MHLNSGLLVSLVRSPSNMMGSWPLSSLIWLIPFFHFKTTLLELGITSQVFAIYTYLPRVNKDHLFVIFHTCSMYLLRPVHHRLHNYQHLKRKHTLYQQTCSTVHQHRKKLSFCTDYVISFQSTSEIREVKNKRLYFEKVMA